MRLRAVLLILTFALPAPMACARDPDALWRIVSTQCVPGQQDHGDQAPCAEVDLAAGAAVLKDRRGATQYLLIPTARLAGIESPELLDPATPDFFALAWQARQFTEARAGRFLPPEAVSLAINSAYSRSQNELHIHIDCVRAEVRDALRDHQAALDTAWHDFPVPLAGRTWLARRAEALRPSPFILLADGVPGAAAEMGAWTLVAVGTAPGGFVLLAARADPMRLFFANGEALQDHTCALARE